MSSEFRDYEIRLKKNIEILDNTFEKFGFKVTNVGAEYGHYLGGEGIIFFIEIMDGLDSYCVNEPDYVSVKINVYSSNDELISMGNSSIEIEDFSGFDTVDIGVFHEGIHEEATKAKIYMTKDM